MAEFLKRLFHFIRLCEDYKNRIFETIDSSSAQTVTNVCFAYVQITKSTRCIELSKLDKCCINTLQCVQWTTLNLREPDNALQRREEAFLLVERRR